MKTSQRIKNHPAVLDYDIDDTESWLRHDVILKDGYSFHGLDIQGERRTGLFKTVKEFFNAIPAKDI